MSELKLRYSAAGDYVLLGGWPHLTSVLYSNKE